MPGDSRFPLNAFIHQPSPNEASKLREYLKQVRLETSKRMIEHALKVFTTDCMFSSFC